MTLPGDKVTDTQCTMGYVRVDGACEETCALTPCQELIEIRKSYSQVNDYMHISVRHP